MTELLMQASSPCAGAVGCVHKV